MLQVGWSADLDAPTPSDISKEFWGYLDPDSPTPRELSNEVRVRIILQVRDAQF